MQEHKHLVGLLKEAKKAARDDDVFQLRNLSNQTVHSATIFQDTDNIIVAVLIYTLSKLIEKRDSLDSKNFQKYLTFYLNTIDDLILYANTNNEKLFRNKAENIMGIKGLSDELKKSVQDVFRKSRINKASRIYEHGISMETTARLLGISLWELAEYTGQSSSSEVNYNQTVDIKKRIKNAMEFFG